MGLWDTARAIGAAVARFPDTEEVTGSIPVSPTSIIIGPRPSGARRSRAGDEYDPQTHLVRRTLAPEDVALRLTLESR